MPPRNERALTVLVVREADAKVRTVRLSRRTLIVAGSVWFSLALGAALWGFQSAGASDSGVTGSVARSTSLRSSPRQE